MGTIYTGRDPFTPPAYLSPYGHFISGLACDDGDLDDAAVLNALAMAALDSIQWLAWRTINIVDGDAGNPALTAVVINHNVWGFEGQVTFSAAATGVIFETNAVVAFAKTLHIGDSALGVGHIIADGAGAGAGSDIKAQNGADIIVTDATGVLGVQSGAILSVDSTSLAQFVHDLASGVTPGGSGRLYATNICKAWCIFHTDGIGNATMDDSYNVDTTVVITPTTITITFKHAFPTQNYCVNANAQKWQAGGAVNEEVYGISWQRAAGILTMRVTTVLNSGGSTIDVTANPVEVTVQIFGRD